MGLYTDSIREKEKNNIKLEKYADEALLKNKVMVRIEKDTEDAQTAVLYILDHFKIKVNRVYGLNNINEMLETLLDPLGTMYDYVESTIDICRRRTEYILAFREDGKSVVLYPSLRGYRYYCPSDDSRGIATMKYCQALNNGCYIFHRPLEEKEALLSTFILNVIKTLTFRDIIKIVIAIGLSTFLGLFIPKISRWVYKEYIGNRVLSGFVFFLTLYILVGISRGIINLIKTMILSETRVRISMKTQSAIMAKILYKPQSFFTNTTSGRLSTRINSCGRLSDMIVTVFIDVLLNFAFSIAYIFQLKNMEPTLFMPAIIFLLIKIVFSYFSAVINAENESKLLDANVENSGFLYSSIRGIQKIKGMGAENTIYSKWAETYRKILSYTYQQPFVVKHNQEILSFLSTGATIFILTICVFKNISSEDYMTFLSSYTLIVAVVSSLTDIMQNLFLMQTLSNNIRPIFETQNEQVECLEYVRNLRGSIRVEDIHFAYGDDPRGCLRGVSIDIKPGEKVAIVGESGCGKTTLLKVILGLENASKGEVFFDGKSINSLNMKSLRRHIGSVFQFSKVFPGTIADNVVFQASEPVSEDRIWEAVDKAAIGDYIRNLPLKLDTEISESNSSGFSGGQRQRILLARAFLNKPRILILDEATSALDNLTQNKVLETINNLNTTVIMVAHRLSTVIGFDRIIMLEDGEIVEEGTYESLMAKNDKFAELVRKQLV